MADAALLWNEDIGSGNTGDIALATGTMLGQQRVLRRLLTNPGDYVWHPDYGAGLARFIGKPCDAASVRSAIRSQIFEEACVARQPEPVIDVRAGPDGYVYVQIRYIDATNGETQLLSFNLGG